MRLLAVLILSSFYFSCAYNPISVAPRSFNSSNTHGLIAGSVSIINQRGQFNGVAFYYRQIESSNKRQHKILITPEQFGFRPQPDYLIKDTMVYQFILKHPPGDYEFTNYEMVYPTIIGSSKLTSKKDFSIQFKIEEGQISYLGDIVFIPNKNIKGFQIEWQGNIERELDKFQLDFPNINWETMKDRTPVRGVFYSKQEIEFLMEEY